MEAAIVVGVLVAIGVGAAIISKRSAQSVSENRHSTEATGPASPARPYSIGDSLGDDHFEGRVEAISQDGKLAAGVCVARAITSDDGQRSVQLVTVDAVAGSVLGEKRIRRILSDDEAPWVALITRSEIIITREEAESGADKIAAYAPGGARLWAKTLSIKQPADHLQLSLDERRLLLSWRGIAYALLDVETGQQTRLRKWRKRETGLSVNFAANGSLEATFKHDGPAGSREARFMLDEEGNPPAEYYEVRDAAVTEDERADHRIVLPRLKELLNKKPPEHKKAERLIRGLEPHKDNIPDSQKPYFLRYKGEVALANGDREKALQLWSEALALDPKVGIKGRYEREMKKAAPAE